MTVDEAARHLGLSVDAVRKRVQRDQIAYEKEPAGRVRIILDEDETLQDEGQDATGPTAELIEELRDRVEFLQRELERKDAILLNMTEAMKAIAPPAHEEAAASEATEPPGASPEATEQPGRVEPQPQVEAAQRSSWWRRLFGA